MAPFRKLILCCALALPVAVTAQLKVTTTDLMYVKQKLYFGSDVARYFSSITDTITSSSTHNQAPTAKSIYNFVTGKNYLATVTTTARLTGAGTSGSPLDIAQQSATTGQVLRWSGSAWIPNGTNLYDIVTTGGSIAAQYNQVWVNTISASISLNLPACNSANDGVKIEIAKAGSDTHEVIIEPAGSEQFSDGNTSKSIFSQGTGISCTCRWTGSVGVWLYTNM